MLVDIEHAPRIREHFLLFDLLVSWENGYKQMLIVLNSFAVLYLNLIGQNKYSCQNFDQATALLQSGQKLATRT